MPRQPLANLINNIMTTKIITIVAATAIMSACTSNIPQQQQGFATDSLKYENKTHTSVVTLKADYPTQGNKTLINAVSEYVSEQLGGSYNGNLANGDSLIAYYGQQQTARLDELANEAGGSSAQPLYYSQTITITAQTEKYVSYTDICETFLGGAHGSGTMSGITFRKSDGRRFGHEMLKNTNTQEFRDLLKEGLKQYFSANGQEVETDEQLAEIMFAENGVDYLPLPQAAPYLTADGVAFVYQSYEIAPYALGRPTFTIPYSKIEPFLTETVKKLLRDNANPGENKGK